jgi:hypothetical protein
LIRTAHGLGAGLVYQSGRLVALGSVHFHVGSYEPLGAEGTTGHMNSVDLIPFLAPA